MHGTAAPLHGAIFGRLSDALQLAKIDREGAKTFVHDHAFDTIPLVFLE